MTKVKPFAPRKNLRGLRIWLSGAIPEMEFWGHPLTDRDILEFVASFSGLVFQKGGVIIHGCHPIFTPILFAQAKRFASEKAQLRLFVSELWGKGEFAKFETNCTLELVPSFQNSRNAADSTTRDSSLTLLREKMAALSDCIVSIGGKLHLGSGFKAGVTEELLLAKAQPVPAYNLGGFGGAAGNYVGGGRDNVFLSAREAAEIFYDTDISFLASKVISLLARDRFRILYLGKLFRLLKKLSVT